ncbi:MAG: sulfatase-like hydrolase/transferase, partial [Myxococcales bacterium]|nr:sulfatase-like hydrolase/transferase [Myxococcales bacterium]
MASGPRPQRWPVLALASVLACGSDPVAAPPDGGTVAVPGFGDGPVADRVMLSLLDTIAACEIDHRGGLLDMGTDMVRGRARQRGTDAGPLESVEHDGATWSIVDERTLETSFVTTVPQRLFVSARLQPIAAKSVAASIDDVPLGGQKIKKNEPFVFETSPSELPFDPGEHTITLRFGPAKAKEAYAHVDWVRVGVPDDSTTTYGAPTLPDVVQPDAVLSKVPHKALRLRVPTSVRCPLRVPKEARLRTALGLLGVGEADAEISVRVDGKEPVSLLKKTVKGGETQAWEDVDVSLDAFAGQLVEIELAAVRGAAPGRLLFGDPEVVVPTAQPEDTKRAQVVVVVVLSGVDRDELPFYSARPVALERLGKLAEASTVFLHHRASATVIQTNLATLFSGLPPKYHTVHDPGSALPGSVPTISQRARDASIQTGFFTGVPHSFKPFGLTRGFAHVVEISPAEGEGRDALTEAATWLATSVSADPSGNKLLVVHAKGGHPPWVVTPKQIEALPPENYTGDIQPRRAAEQLASFRRRKSKAGLPEPDLVRASALHQIALADQDRALGQLLDALDTANLEDKALIIVTADTSSGISTLFADQPPFDERSLELPLYVSFPDKKLAGRRVDAPTGIEDVTRTMIAALGLSAPRASPGRDLAHVASGLALPAESARFALFGDSYSVRDGNLLLRERPSSKDTLCELLLDPTCTFDRRPQYPFAATALSRSLAGYREATPTPHPE